MPSPNDWWDPTSPFPWKRRSFSVVRGQAVGYVVYGYKTQEHRDTHLQAEKKVAEEIRR